MNILKEIDNILSKYDFISTALVFGSYAANTFTSMSDIDIAVGTTRELTLPEIGEIISILESKLRKKIDLVILNNLPYRRPLLAYNIYRKHVLIFSRDTSFYHQFKTDTLHAYMDFKHIIDAQNKAFDQRIHNGTLAETQTA